ncbi:hypothetical protein ACFCVY_35420 [Streptomyces sp. NPDC056411]|uniref:hypothetical protein n=1 Tax=Streptomyces sp. NPDC056411 TaxID=3345813 RepID=UPI0035E31898
MLDRPPPVPYDATTDRLEKLAVIVRGTTIVLRGVRLWSFPDFVDTVTVCLTQARGRLTVEVLAAAW